MKDVRSLYFRQLLSGRDIASGDEFAQQMVNYSYAIGDRDCKQAILIDPAHAPGELVAALAEDGMQLVGVALTHYHADHAGGPISGHHVAGIADLLATIDVPVHINRSEMEWVARSTGVSRDAFVVHDGGDELNVGNIEITLLHTPGHTPGSQCLLVDNNVLTGDTLFLSGCGRTDLPGGDASTLYDTLTKTISKLPAFVSVFPGHAYDEPESSPIGTLLTTNPVLLPRERESWLALFGS